MTKMKTRGSWVKIVKFAGLAGLVCGLLGVAAFRGAGKRSPQTGAGLSQAAASQASRISAMKGDPKWNEAYGKLPLSFEENQGQTAREVRYVSHGNGYELFLTPQEAVLTLHPAGTRDLSPLRRAAFVRAPHNANRTFQTTAIRLRLERANPNPQISGADRLPTRVNYFIGNDPTKWHTDVPSFARVKYAGVYPGVDLVFYGNQRRLEYDFIVAPGADPKAIALKVEGARKMHVNSRGDLLLGVPGGEVKLQKPLVYQNVNGERREIASRYSVGGDHRVTFLVAAYDRSEPLVVDPVLNYSTYLGGSAADAGFAIAVDHLGDAFVAGQTMSIDFPAGTTAGIVNTQNPNSGAAFVAELNPAGNTLLYTTYLVGTTTSPNDSANGVAVDSSGKVYVTGVTFAAGFPSKSPLPYSADTTNGTCFVTKLDPTQGGNGSLIFSTYLGGTGGDVGNAIAVDASGNAYVAGFTKSTDFPTMNAYQPVFNPLNVNNAAGSAFLSRIDTALFKLVYSTYLSGNAAHSANPNASGVVYGDAAIGVAVDGSNNAYVVGSTTSTNPTNAPNFPSSASAFQTAPPAGNTTEAVFVSKIDTTKTGSPSASLIYSTYLAGSTDDQGNAIALGPNNVVYVTGTTSSNDFPVFPLPGPGVPGAFDTTGAASGKAFISLVDTTKSGVSSVTYSTFLGGTSGDHGFGIKADAAGNAYVAGTTDSSDFPGTKTLGAFQSTLPNTIGSPFIAKLNPGGNAKADLLYSTYFGGTGDTSNADQGFGIAIDTANPPNAYITGQTFSANMPVVSHLPTGGSLNPPTGSDAFVAKLALIPTLTVTPTALNFGTILIPNTSAAQMVTLTNNTAAAIAFTSATLTGANAADFAVSANTCGASIAAGASCTVSATFKPSAPPISNETATLVLTDADSTSPQNISLTGSGTSTPPDFTVTASAAVPSTVKAGSSAVITVTVTPIGGFSSAVALTCAEPAALTLSTCTASPASVTPNGAAVQSQVTVTTTAPSLMMPPFSMPTRPLPIRQIIPLLLALILLFLLPTAKRLRLRLAMATAMLVLIALAGCSGPSAPKKPGTTPGTYNLTITGTSGGTAHSAPAVSLTVN
jgi:hypothetical protein